MQKVSIALLDLRSYQSTVRIIPLIILSGNELNSWPWLFLAVVFGADGGVGAGPVLTFSNSLEQDCFPW